ncbi:MAG: tetratricopeptide repeat protein [Myxococcales bacterium]|nr:tetratricopeptide repeat protein [Myxococcales bacterium]
MSRSQALVNLSLTVALGVSWGLDARIVRAASTGAEESHEPAEADVPGMCQPSQGFVVQPFDNSDKVGALRYLEAGLPALVADRFWTAHPLRFVGPRSLLAAVAPGAEAPLPRDDVAWIVSGQFATRPGTRLAVTVTVRSAAPGAGEVASTAHREGSRQDAPRLVLEAAREAFVGLPHLHFEAEPRHAQTPFSRDAYAFVLYARGVSSHLGLGGMAKAPEAAARWLTRSLVIDPRVPETRRYLGLIHLEANRPGHARTLFALALDDRPDYVPALSALSALERDTGSPEALALFERLLALDPGAWHARRSYGELLYAAGRLPEARTALEAVLERKSDDLQARRLLTLVLSAQKAGAALVLEFETIVKLDPDNVTARLDLAAAYLNEGRLSEAAASYDAVLERQPRHKEALKIAGDLARQEGQLDEAAKRYERLRRLVPEDPRPVFLLGAVYHQAGNLEAAERMFTEAAQHPQLRAEAWSNLGAVMLEQGRAKEARWLLMKAARSRPNKASVRYNYAVALRALEQHADALNELRAAAEADPQDPQIRFAAGVVALRLGLLREAQAEFGAALALDPGHEGAKHNLKLLTKVTGGREEAAGAGVETVN